MTIVGASGVIRLRLPPPPADYDERYEAVRNMSLENADRSNFKHFEDVDLANNERVIVVSDAGVRWYLTVTDGGTLGTAAV